jgi:hypothetical protein
VQALPSLHIVADEAGGAVQFPEPSQAPAMWQMSMAGHVVVPMQVPEPLQWSEVVQDLLSLQLCALSQFAKLQVPVLPRPLTEHAPGM